MGLAGGECEGAMGGVRGAGVGVTIGMWWLSITTQCQSCCYILIKLFADYKFVGEKDGIGFDR